MTIQTYRITYTCPLSHKNCVGYVRAHDMQGARVAAQNCTDGVILLAEVVPSKA